MSSRQEAPDPTFRRVHEVYGILTLAAVLLLGLSLISVQFGKGTLMGPFGHAVGTTLNWALGLASYLAIAGLLMMAIRIFAGGLGKGPSSSRARKNGEEEEVLSPASWRERLGLALGVFCFSILLHLIIRPSRIGNASAGGVIGELSGEILCVLVSTPGTWIITLTGLALSAVLTTSLSWAQAGILLGQTFVRLTRGVGAAGQNAWKQLCIFTTAMIHTIQHRTAEAEVEPDGTATLPPVIRLDMAVGGTPPSKRNEKKKPRVMTPLPLDLEIGASESEQGPDKDDQAPSPKGEQGDKAKPAKKSQAGQGVSAHTAAEGQEKDSKKGDGSKKEGDKRRMPEQLTIVEARFLKSMEQAQADEKDHEKKVEQTDGPGFILNGDTYKPPPMSLLKFEENKTKGVDREAIFRQAELLVKTLSDYKIEGRITEVHPGPVVTMYEFVPVSGTRISKVASLANDLAMSLAAQRVRIVAPIPGKGAIGIEVPNDTRETVFFKEIVANNAFRKGKSKLGLALGKSIAGAPVVMDLAKMPHLLVAGATGAGKSVSINAMICSLLMKHTPEEVRLIMVDPKFLELSGYNDIPHLLLPVVTDPKKANVALRWAVAEMERRYQLLADAKVRDITAYNRKVNRLRGAAKAEELQEEGPGVQSTIDEAKPEKILKVRHKADGEVESLNTIEDAGAALPAQTPEEAATGEAKAVPDESSTLQRPAKKAKGPLPKRLPYIVVVIDEFADLMMVASKEVETSVARLAQKARAAGVHVILATQRPSVDVITGLIKANFPSRVSFQVASSHDSKTILGANGAENLLGAGDMLVLDRGSDMKRIHGAYISDGEIQRVVEWLRDQGRPVYDMDILKAQEEDEVEPEEEEVVDAMYDRAVALVAESRQASISWVQRQLRVGYNRAARMVERMERDGVVGPADGVRGREVLIQHYE